MRFSSHTKTLRTFATFGIVLIAVLIIAGLWTAIAALRPLPPRTVTMATGPEGSDFYEFGKRYRDILARDGVEVRLVSTAGAIENLSRLNDKASKIEIGFLLSGTTDTQKSPALQSLGTVSYEPLWFFYRGTSVGRGLSELRGKKISIGPEGSGSRKMALKLLALNGIDEKFAQLLPFTPQEAGEKLLRGEIDTALMLTSWDTPIVRRLLTNKTIQLASFSRTDAYVALYPFLNKLVVPEGVGDLANNRPPKDTVLFATKACLVVRSDLHPAIQYLLLDAAEQIHSGPGIFQKAGEFPALESFDLPLSEDAREFYKSGKPFLQRHLPFWAAVLIYRLALVGVPVLGIVYPLVRVMPAVYGYQLRRRIFKLHKELWSLEQELIARRPGESIEDIIARLDELQGKADRIHMPLVFSSMLYTWRIHMGLVKERIKEREEGMRKAA